MQQQRNQTYREIAGLSKLRLAIFTAVAVAGLVSSAHFIARSMRLPVANYIIILSHLWKNMPIPSCMLKQLMSHMGRTDKKHNQQKVAVLRSKPQLLGAQPQPQPCDK